MELHLRSADRTVYIDTPVAPEGTTMNVAIYDGDTLVETVGTVVADPLIPGRFSITIPYHLVTTERDLVVRWEFEYIENGGTHNFVEETAVSVVTPYVSIAEVKAIIGDEATTEEAIQVERDVRLIINAHCGQSFGRFDGIKSVRGTRESALLLPERLYHLVSIEQEGFGYKVYDLTNRTGNDWLGKTFFNLTGDGWYINMNRYSPDGIKSDNGYWSVNGPIYNPYRNISSVLGPNVTLLIDGSWGYPSVPVEVKEAAKLLVNDYACQENLYRDRYLTNVSTSDWRLLFGAGAFQMTGNLRADNLLSKYVVKRGWAVI